VLRFVLRGGQSAGKGGDQILALVEEEQVEGFGGPGEGVEVGQMKSHYAVIRAGRG
jgi:hypothetical protein